MSQRGELARLAEIARPDVGVVTRVSAAHLEFFASVDEIALAKRELIEGLNGRESTAVLNADDPRVAAFGAVAPGRVLTYGIDAAAFFSAENIEDRGALGSAFDYVSPEGRVRLDLSLPGRHAISERAGGAGGGQRLGHWRGGSAAKFFAQLRAPAMRGRAAAIFKWGGTDQRQLQLESRGAAGHDGIAGGHAEFQAAHSGGGRNAGAGSDFRGAASRGGTRRLRRPERSTGLLACTAMRAEIVEGAVAAGFPASAAQNFSPRRKRPAKFLEDFVDSRATCCW